MAKKFEIVINAQVKYVFAPNLDAVYKWDCWMESNRRGVPLSRRNITYVESLLLKRLLKTEKKED